MLNGASHSLYFSRVLHIFQDAAVSRPELQLQRIIDACEAVGTESAQCDVSVCSFRESPIIFCTMRDTDSYNRAILTVLQFQGAENDPFEPHGCIVLSESVRMSLSFEIVYLVCVQLGRGTSSPPSCPSTLTHRP